MYKTFRNIIAVMVLALVVSGGSFVVSAAATAPADTDAAAAEASAKKAPLWVGHPSAELREEVVEPTCTEDGHRDEYIWCVACGREKPGSRTSVEIIPALGHIHGDVTEENHVDATCTADGSYDEVSHCTLCGEEFREAISIPALGHTHGEPVEENRVEPTDTEDGSCDMVVYCEICGEELSRESVVLPATGITEPIIDPTDEPGDNPIDEPSDDPIDKPGDNQDDRPVVDPSDKPDDRPVVDPSDKPDDKPVVDPSNEPVTEPADEPSTNPILDPAPEPVVEPEPEPVVEPEPEPAVDPEPIVKPEPEPAVDPDPIDEEIFFEPKAVTIEDFGNSYIAMIDEAGRAVFEDFFHKFDDGASASESLTMVVDGASYDFTRYSDGSIKGLLPKGFAIDGQNLIISGLTESLDIYVSDHTAMSAISEESVFVAPPEISGEEVVEGAFEPPVILITDTGANRESRSYGAGSTTTAPGNSINSYAESLLDDISMEDSETANTAKSIDSAEAQKPESAPIASSESSAPVEFKDVSSSKLLLAANLALISGLIIGIGVLWRLGVLRF